MIRLAVFTLAFLGLAIIQNSFFASLPGVLPLWPLILAVGVYLLQHQSLTAGAWLIAANGLFLDLFHLQMVPAETISYLLTALAAAYSAKHVFSNRSLYGVLACGSATFGVLKLSQMAILGLVWLREAEQVDWTVFSRETFWSGILLMIGLLLLFPFAVRIKKLLHKSFFVSQRDTF
ncbi:hypothetical protein KJ611_01595 [Patescibacteria group bacterium]|nr:hypothetical protein [Patescibacteria group bacterium]MBU1705334.1 hypothetical protein [Patescibacteria group bacterium]